LNLNKLTTITSNKVDPGCGTVGGINHLNLKSDFQFSHDIGKEMLLQQAGISLGFVKVI